MIFAVLCGCATPPSYDPVKPSESVAITVTQGALTTGPIKIHNESVGNASKEGLVGAGAGAVAGGLWGLACGPLAALCVPLGVLAGADVGVLAGLAVGTTAALPDDKADRLRDRVTQALQSRDLRSEFEASLIERAKPHWNLDADDPNITVEVELRDISLASTRDERIRCVFNVAVVVRGQATKRAGSGKERAYAYVCPYGSLAAWLDEGSGLIDSNLTAGVQHLATQIVSDLEAGGGVIGAEPRK